MKPLKPWNNEDFETQYGNVDYRDKIVMDIGAEIGTTAYFFLTKGAREVIAVEGYEPYFKELVKNIDRDNRVKPIKLWITSENDFEKLIEKHNPDIVKVDIEGAEISLIKVSPEVLSKPSVWIIETHSLETKDVLISKFLNAGYKLTREFRFAGSIYVLTFEKQN